MTVITAETVEKIAALANLSLSDDEKLRFQKDLNRIVEYMGQLKQVDVSGADEICHAFNIPARLREDRAEKSISPQEALKNAPHRKDDYFRVPRVILKDQNTASDAGR
jgi:aspartyl-tRNA(Asn)/glutamyl-tRNA(Gln) amidotransferase subunit C